MPSQNPLDAFAKALALPHSRRQLLGLLGLLPLVSGLTGILTPENLEAKGRRKRRVKRHKHGKGRRHRDQRQKRKKPCVPDSVAQTCAGTCGSVTNNCQQPVDCGSCACTPACEVCFTCQEGPNTPGQCVADPAQQGQACGEPGQICLSSGTCACDAGSCTAPETCGGGGTPGECGCTPLGTCPDGYACGTIPDGCGGNLSCGICENPTPICTDHICLGCTSNTECGDSAYCDAGSCQACDVTCTGTAEECGAALQAAIDSTPGEGTLYVCPGRYRGGFSIVRPVTIVGAGQEADPTSNTVLDGNDAARVLFILVGIGSVTLERLHLRKGDGGASGGGGLFFAGPHLTVRDCTVAENRAEQGGGVVIASSGILEMTRCTVRDNIALFPSGSTVGGGIRVDGQATFTDCQIIGNEVQGGGGGICALAAVQLVLAGATTVRDNTAQQGGGLYVFNTPTTIGESCQITENTALEGSGAGGGIFNAAGTVTLEGSADPSPIVTHNCQDNCAGDDIARCAPGGSCPT